MSCEPEACIVFIRVLKQLGMALLITIHGVSALFEFG